MSPKRGGFLLIEAMFATTLLVVCVVVILGGYRVSMRSIKMSQSYFHAGLLLEEKMWEIEKSGNLPSVLSEADPFLGDIEWKTETHTEDSLERLDVTLFWNQSGRQEDLGLSTYLSP